MKKIIISFLCFIMFLACDVPEYDFNEFYDADPPALVFQPFLKKVVAGSVNRVDIEALEITGTAGMYIKMEYDPDFVAIKEVVAGEFFFQYEPTHGYRRRSRHLYRNLYCISL